MVCVCSYYVFSLVLFCFLFFWFLLVLTLSSEFLVSFSILSRYGKRSCITEKMYLQHWLVCFVPFCATLC
uniref:Uncharacterized protein n=1 Tax=Anopheles darlingi TaxID=43151 RepID=A0A2M4D5B4_ANODA